MSSTIYPSECLSGEGSVRKAGAPFADGSQLLYLAEAGFLAESIVDGPGLRCVVFVQGCPHNCPGCHNPATHPFSGGAAATVAHVRHAIKQSRLCRAVTLSGGEPFCQAGALAALATQLKADGYELAAYTGYTFEQLLAGEADRRALLGVLDTLIDGPFLQAQKDLSLRFRGSANQRIINVPKSLAAGAAVWREDSRWVGGPGGPV